MKQDNLQVRFQRRLFGISSFFICIAVVVIQLSTSTRYDVVFLGIMLVGWIAVGLWTWRGVGGGVIRVDEAGITVKSGFGTKRLPWVDLESLEVAPARQLGTGYALMLGLFLIDADEPVVIARLPHDPTFIRVVALYPRDVDDFVQVVARYRPQSVG